MKILVTGGTGTLGKHVVPSLRAAGAEVVVLSRHSGLVCDLLTEVPKVDADVVVHLAGGQKGDDIATRNLLAGCAGVRHFVYISVIGADTVPLTWLRTKLAAEQVVEGSGLPWTILRAAQFHDLAFTMAKGMAKLPVVPVPSAVRLQPVDVRDVAARIAALALAAPAGRVPDLAGPAVYPLPDLVRSYLRAASKRRPLLPVPLPGKAGRAYREGANLTLEGADHGTGTWEDFLAAKLR